MNIESALHMINMAVEYILVALVILVCVRFISIRNSYASALNDKSALQKEVNNNLEYRAYNTDEEISGNNVIAAIRNYKDGRIRITVDFNNTEYPGGTEPRSPIVLDKTKALETYKYSVVKLTDKTTGICETENFHAYLIYDNDEMDNYSSKGIEITGITFVKVP